MPELPEVETTRRGIEPYIKGQTIEVVIVRQPALRWPVPDDIHLLEGSAVEEIKRRGKYLLIRTAAGSALLHLGMSGSLRVCSPLTPVEKHDHVDFVFANARCLRLRDPRRFGAVLFTADPQRHALLEHLGPEPLSEAFHADHLHALSRGKRCSVKALIMDSGNVVGVGNIYASESLYLAGINPKTQAGRISLQRYQKLVMAIKQVLRSAIEQGGTTLRDFVSAEGQSGYFQIMLQVYGRAGQPCKACGKAIRQIVQNQRSSYYCPHCQH